MKTGFATALIALAMPVCVFATTLRLSGDIDLRYWTEKGFQLVIARG